MTLDYNGHKVEVSQPNGNVGAWHVTIDKIFQGQIVKNNGQWLPTSIKEVFLPGMIFR